MAKRTWYEANLTDTPSHENVDSKAFEPKNSHEASTEKLKVEPSPAAGATTEVKTPEFATEAAAEVAGEEESTVDAFWSLLGRAGYIVW